MNNYPSLIKCCVCKNEQTIKLDYTNNTIICDNCKLLGWISIKLKNDTIKLKNCKTSHTFILK